jgi:hypothetical protein
MSVSKALSNRAYSGIDVENIFKGIKNNKFEVTSLKEFKQLVFRLSKPDSKLSQYELNQIRKLSRKYGGKIRVDLQGVRGSGVNPHVHIENLGNKIESRHIWLKEGVK